MKKTDEVMCVRRVFCLMLALLLCTSATALGEEMAGALQASDALFAEISLRLPGLAPQTRFAQSGQWMSAIATYSGAEGEETLGVVYDMGRGALVTWEDLFVDGEAAAQRIATIAEASVYDNAYAERNAIRPVPRDSFAIDGGRLYIYYPASQLAHFSGRAGAFAFYAYELAGLLGEDVPLTAGNTMQARQALEDALATGALPDIEAAIGDAIAPIADSAGLVDVPDIKREAAVWLFEAPDMRGVSVLSGPEDINQQTAVVSGILAEAIDFSGLCVGQATRDLCLATLGDPGSVVHTDTTDAYSLLPAGETLLWAGGGRELGLHFVDDVLAAVLLRTAA